MLGRLHMITSTREDMKNRNITSQHPNQELVQHQELVVEQAEPVDVDGGAEAGANRNIE